MQNCASKFVKPWFAAVHRGDGPHSERSALESADSVAVIVTPLAAEVCDEDADPDTSTLVSLTLMLSVNEGVETAIACEVATEWGVAFGLLNETEPDHVLGNTHEGISRGRGAGRACGGSRGRRGAAG